MVEIPHPLEFPVLLLGPPSPSEFPVTILVLVGMYELNWNFHSVLFLKKSFAWRR